MANQFVWGTILGAVLTLVANFVTGRLQLYWNRRERQLTVENFVVDQVKNIHALTTQLSDEQTRHQIFDRNLPDLIDVEIEVVARNREHFALITDDAARSGVRKFFNTVAILESTARVELGRMVQSQIDSSNAAEPHKRQMLYDEGRVHLDRSNTKCRELVDFVERFWSGDFKRLFEQ